MQGYYANESKEKISFKNEKNSSVIQFIKGDFVFGNTFTNIF